MYIVLLSVLIAFLKFTSCDDQALVGCIPIAAVAVHLNLKSQKLVSHLIRCIAITYWIFKSLFLDFRILNACTKRTGNLLKAPRKYLRLFLKWTREKLRNMKKNQRKNNNYPQGLFPERWFWQIVCERKRKRKSIKDRVDEVI